MANAVIAVCAVCAVVIEIAEGGVASVVVGAEEQVAVPALVGGDRGGGTGTGSGPTSQGVCGRFAGPSVTRRLVWSACGVVVSVLCWGVSVGAGLGGLWGRGARKLMTGWPAVRKTGPPVLVRDLCLMLVPGLVGV